ncbi:hypothetical protein Pint_10552 [Pistacia integerrima]|uniref:Uncharacterized protein n=1 Tax=Pistacia integerrima TaxID=434235 RepID=A0ACC0XK81_9ROSI|nr:hypothetical protein Pint_10552 [Pistacia integerrima]
MDSKLWLIFLLSAVLMVVQSIAFTKEMYGDENLMESWSGRRQLESRQYVSYSALFADTTPCQKRGQSYFNCKTGAQANPPPPNSSRSDFPQTKSSKSDPPEANSPTSDPPQADSSESDYAR